MGKEHHVRDAVVTLPRQTVTYANIQAVGNGSVITMLAWGISHFFLPDPWATWVPWWVGGLVVVLLLTDFCLNKREQRYFVARFHDGELVMHRGRLLTTRTALVPGSILSVDVQAGPLLKRLGLAKMTLNGVAALPEIPPLALGDAKRVQQLLTTLDNPVTDGRGV